MNKTIKKLTIAVVALSLVLLGVVGGVIAWLTAESGTVTNTFSYGTINIALSETSGSLKATVNGTGLDFTHVVPGDKLEKEVTVTVKEGSEKCYVYVLVTNNLAITSLNGAAPAYDIDLYDAGSNSDGKWALVATSADNKTMLYRYTATVNAVDGDKELPVFNNVIFAGNLTNADIEQLEAIDEGIVLKAYAHQAENLADTDDASVALADAAAKTWAGVTP